MVCSQDGPGPGGPAHMAAEKRPQFRAGYLQKHSVPHLVGLFVGFPERPRLLQPASPEGVILGGARRS